MNRSAKLRRARKEVQRNRELYDVVAFTFWAGLVLLAMFFLAGCRGTFDGIDLDALVGPGEVTLLWDPPTTNEDGTPLTDLSHYRVYVDGALVAETEGPPIIISEMPPKVYTFTVTAVDTSGNESLPSEALAVPVYEWRAP